MRGPTTAASVWLTSAVGMAAGAGLWLLAVLVTAGYFIVVFALTPIAARLPRSRYAPSRLRLTYLDGQGVLRQVLVRCTDRDPHTVSVGLTVQGRGSLTELTADLAEIRGVVTVAGDDENAPQP